MSKVSKDKRSIPNTKDQYRARNWSEYNQALVKRGNITLYFDEDVINGWHSEVPPQQGAQEVYSDQCIEAIMLLKTVFKMGYRQVTGFTRGILDLMGLEDLAVPSYTQVNRGFGELDIAPYVIPATGPPIVLAIDSTGIKVYGEGEWQCRKHGWSKRRTWRKLHLGVDPDTNHIHCHTTTTNAKSDESQVVELLDQVDAPLAAVCLDGAHDAQSCYDELSERDVEPTIPPQRGAVKWHWEEPGDADDYARNRYVDRIAEIGRKEWKKEIGYHRRSLSETAMFRFKSTFGPRHYSRKLTTQIEENKLKIKVLNMMTAQGMPRSEKKTA